MTCPLVPPVIFTLPTAPNDTLLALVKFTVPVTESAPLVRLAVFTLVANTPYVAFNVPNPAHAGAVANDDVPELVIVKL